MCTGERVIAKMVGSHLIFYLLKTSLSEFKQTNKQFIMQVIFVLVLAEHILDGSSDVNFIIEMCYNLLQEP